MGLFSAAAVAAAATAAAVAASLTGVKPVMAVGISVYWRAGGNGSRRPRCLPRYTISVVCVCVCSNHLPCCLADGRQHAAGSRQLVAGSPFLLLLLVPLPLLLMVTA